MGFAKSFGSKFGKKFLNKGVSASQRIKDTLHYLNLVKVNMVKY